MVGGEIWKGGRGNEKKEKEKEKKNINTWRSPRGVRREKNLICMS